MLRHSKIVRSYGIRTGNRCKKYLHQYPMINAKKSYRSTKKLIPVTKHLKSIHVNILPAEYIIFVY